MMVIFFSDGQNCINEAYLVHLFGSLDICFEKFVIQPILVLSEIILHQ